MTRSYRPQPQPYRSQPHRSLGLFALVSFSLLVGSTALAQQTPSDGTTADAGVVSPNTSPDQPATPPADPTTTAAPATTSTDEPSGATATTPPASGDDQSGAGQTGTPTTAVEQVDAPPARPPVLWRNSALIFNQFLSAYSFAPSGHLTYNPSYSWNVSLRPRWYLEPMLFLVGRFDLNIEWTLSDTDTRSRDVVTSDIFISLIRPAIVHEGNFTLTVGGRVALPVSISSRAADRYFSVAALATAAYAFPEANIQLQYDAFFTYNFAGSNVMKLQTPYPAQVQEPNLPGLATSVAGLTNTEYNLFTGPTVLWSPMEALTVSATLYYGMRRGFGLRDAYVLTASGERLVVPDMSPSHFRQSLAFYASIAYDVTPWLNLSLNYGNSSGVFGAEMPGLSGSYFSEQHNVFWTQDAYLGVTAFFTLDQLYEQIVGSGQQLTPEQLRRIRQGQAQNRSRAASSMF